MKEQRELDVVYSLFIIASLTGIIAALWYRPGDAHATTETIRATAPFLQGAHNFASRTAIIVGLVGILYLSTKRKYDAEWRLGYFGTVILWLGALGAQITGNALPMDQHDVRTVVVEAGIAGRVPAVGPITSKLMLGGDQFSPFTTQLWYGAHIALILALVAPFLLARRLRVGYKFSFATLFVIAIIAIGSSFASSFPTGSAATAADYANFDAQPSWYTMPMHAMLNAFDQMGRQGWIGAAVIPALTVGFLLFLPKLAGEHPKAFWRWSVALLITIWTGVTLAFGGGNMAPLNGNQDEVVAKPEVQTEIKPIDPKLVEQGRVLFQEQGCAGCHGVKLIGGPDLTNMYKKQPNPDWYLKFIKNPKSVKPNSTMPAYENLNENQLKALAEFLRNPKP